MLRKGVHRGSVSSREARKDARNDEKEKAERNPDSPEIEREGCGLRSFGGEHGTSSGDGGNASE
jgi:hypothetical protein